MKELTNKRVAFYTLGCRVNQYETRALEEAFAKECFDIGTFDEKCDVYIINTCTVTAESDRKSRQMIRRARKLGGETAVVMAVGCMVQTAGQDIKLSGLDYACGTREKMSVVKKALELSEQKTINAEVLPTDFKKYTGIEKMSITGSDTTRAFLKICDGCNNTCSYCIIPKARGPICSKPKDDVCREVKTLCENGWREVVLTGIETAAYGKDMKDANLAGLVEEVNQLDVQLHRIRLGSLEPAFMKREVTERFASCKKLMPHYHLSLQSGCDEVLRLMRRKYNTEQFLKVLDNLRELIPDVTFTTDIIVGFPGETEEMFEKTLEFVRKCGFLYVHIFPYSDRNGTEASKMSGKISTNEKKERAARLNQVMLETRRKILDKYKGKTRQVLVETVNDGVAVGHTDNFIEVRVEVGENTGIQKNSLINVIIGEPCNRAEYVHAVLEKANE